MCVYSGTDDSFWFLCYIEWTHTPRGNVSWFNQFRFCGITFNVLLCDAKRLTAELPDFRDVAQFDRENQKKIQLINLLFDVALLLFPFAYFTARGCLLSLPTYKRSSIGNFRHQSTGFFMLISSFFSFYLMRSTWLNSIVGGAAESLHTFAPSIDVIINMQELARRGRMHISEERETQETEGSRKKREQSLCFCSTLSVLRERARIH